MKVSLLLRNESFVILVPLFKRYIRILSESVLRWVRIWSNSPVCLGFIIEHDVIHVVIIHIRQWRVDGASKRINEFCIALIISVQVASCIYNDDSARLTLVSSNNAYHIHHRNSECSHYIFSVTS